MFKVGETLYRRYIIRQIISRSSDEIIYEAIDNRLRMRVALKQAVANTNQRQSLFAREARLLASIRHYALPRVLDYFIKEQDAFLVMEMIDGIDLGARLNEQKRPFSVKQVLSWADKILDALEYLHSRNTPVIHGDIKPQNLMIQSPGNIVLLYFGLKKDPESATHFLSPHNSQYKSPEQLLGQRIDKRSDIYSLAATMYFLMVGVPPTSALKRNVALANNEPDPLKPPHELRAKVPLAISSVIMRAMALESSQRYENAMSIGYALHAAKAHSMLLLPNNDGTVIHGDYVAGDKVISNNVVIDNYAPNYGVQGTFNSPATFGNSSMASKDLSSLSRSTVYALARVLAEDVGIFFTKKSYTLQAGISPREMHGFAAVAAEVDTPSPSIPLIIDILAHSPNEHVEFTSEWQQTIEYIVDQDEPQMVDFTFVVIIPEPIEISVDFYHAARWLRTIKFTFDNVQSRTSNSEDNSPALPSNLAGG